MKSQEVVYAERLIELWSRRVGMKVEPYKAHDGKLYCGHLYLGGDGEHCELDAWAEYTHTGWRIYWTGQGIPQGTRENANGRWATFELARAAWERAARAVSDSEKLSVDVAS